MTLLGREEESNNNTTFVYGRTFRILRNEASKQKKTFLTFSSVYWVFRGKFMFRNGSITFTISINKDDDKEMEKRSSEVE